MCVYLERVGLGGQGVAVVHHLLQQLVHGREIVLDGPVVEAAEVLAGVGVCVLHE